MNNNNEILNDFYIEKYNDLLNTLNIVDDKGTDYIKLLFINNLTKQEYIHKYNNDLFMLFSSIIKTLFINNNTQELIKKVKTLNKGKEIRKQLTTIERSINFLLKIDILDEQTNCKLESIKNQLLHTIKPLQSSKVKRVEHSINQILLLNQKKTNG